MTDPHFDDPKYRDPIPTEPVVRREKSIDRMWGWIAGIAVVALIAFIIIAGWNGNSNTASNAPPAATTGSAPTSSAPPPATTGRAPAPQPATPPATPPATGAK